MKRDELKVCAACGWYEHDRTITKCRPDAGAMVDRLTSAVSVPSTKLGYGTGNFAVQFAENFSLRMHQTQRAGIDGDCYSVRSLFLIRGLSHADAVDLIETLKRWQDRSDRRAEYREAERRR